MVLDNVKLSNTQSQCLLDGANNVGKYMFGIVFFRKNNILETYFIGTIVYYLNHIFWRHISTELHFIGNVF